ncbi:L-ascorbate oxidase-like [Durio zibethinus]|uniref:L-ascorbate oxidase-like n=1 Tax=Durio zibethinus TaxID=66656 RepID=A0A6P5YKA3_DURZI|nr:L-ascorbate oxidase-like [Durio zibethinus]
MFGILHWERIMIMLLVACIFMSLITVPAAAIERHYTWEVTYQYKSLDCYKKLAIAINGLTPGPTISAVQGDTIVVDVINNLLMENVAIHWHGIRQRGTPWSDGTDGVTQCAIMPGETYSYTFVVDRPGTYMYHSHYGMQRESGLYGMINVSLPVGVSEPFNYDLDRGIILSDWYHRTAYEQSTGLSSIPFDWIGEPQSLLISGRGNYNCSGLAPSVCNSTNPQCSPSSLTVISGKTYRLRLASLTSLSSLSFQIEDHEMTVVEADGQYVEPFVTKNLFIYSGETYSVLVTANQDPSRNYWTSINVVSRKPKTPNGLAIFNYYPNHFLKLPPTNPPNANSMTANVSEAHPWHLHGHDFWVLGYGEGKFNLSRDIEKYNLVDPIMKNTVPLHPYGWTALRFQADNPGVWLFHCHIEAHLLLGMLVVFESGMEQVGNIPKANYGCGKTKDLFKP